MQQHKYICTLTKVLKHTLQHFLFFSCFVGMSSSPTHLSVRAFTFHSWRRRTEEEETNLGIPESTLPFPAENGREKRTGSLYHRYEQSSPSFSSSLRISSSRLCLFHQTMVMKRGGEYFGKHLLATGSKPPPPTSSQKRKTLVYRYRFHKLLI